jgi:GTP-binding protein
MIRQRILKESQTDISLKVLPGPTAESIEVRGRGVLHLGVLLETLRREGFELCVGAPKAVLIPDPEDAGKWLEPVEECSIVVKDEYAGSVVEKLTLRKGILVSYEPASNGGGNGATDDFVKIVVDIPSRGLLSYLAGEFKTDVHGQGTLNHIFKGYEPFKGGQIANTGRGERGSLVSMVNGTSSGYAMAPLQARGVMFIEPNTQGQISLHYITDSSNSSYAIVVYPGMIIGETNKPQTLHVNPCLKKQLTNFRTVMADDKVVLGSPRIMGLEEMLGYMSEDEMVEITPKCVRLRKRNLDGGKGARRKGG